MPSWLPDAFGLPLNQRQVDFVIPRLDADLPLCIDPFLLYKSNRQDLKAAHELLLSLFHEAFEAFRQGNEDRVAHLIDFPEPDEIRLGYATRSAEGHGFGEFLSRLLIETLRSSPALIDRGIRHVEELQLFSIGIAEDRISDLAANAIKGFLVEYTQTQCGLWGISMLDGVPIEHIWSPTHRLWIGDYVKLPVDPQTERPILLVPRWIVRRLPWINYPDYERTDLRAFLRSRLQGGATRRQMPKAGSVEITRSHIRLVDEYVNRKEREAAEAKPDPPPLLATAPDATGEELLHQLSKLPIGAAHAHDYQRLALRMLNTLLEPELVDGQEQVRTATGVEIRDLVYTNNSDLPFPRFLMAHHGNLLLVFECKNKTALDPDDINQLANYLGDPMGYCGFILTRNTPTDRIWSKARATYTKQHPRRVIIILDDSDLGTMVSMRRSGSRHPVDHVQRKYRAFIQSVE